jgi:hypothetical protein
VLARHVVEEEGRDRARQRVAQRLRRQGGARCGAGARGARRVAVTVTSMSRQPFASSSRRIGRIALFSRLSSPPRPGDVWCCDTIATCGFGFRISAATFFQPGVWSQYRHDCMWYMRSYGSLRAFAIARRCSSTVVPPVLPMCRNQRRPHRSVLLAPCGGMPVHSTLDELLQSAIAFDIRMCVLAASCIKRLQSPC